VSGAVEGFLARAGLPALVDVHTHFMPDRVMTKVWAYFDRVRDPDGAPGWPVRYREGEAARLARLRGFGVRAFTSLVYPHKPGMAEWLNGWAGRFANANPDCARTATFFPEPSADRYVAEALEAGTRVFKAHFQVGAYDPRDALLAPVWRRLAEAGVPVVVHAASGPEPGPFTGPGPFAEVLEANPGLAAIIAHMGAPEYAEFFELALRFPRVHLDTTMAFTDFMERLAPCPPAVRERAGAHPERIVFGSDFPNIPYPYAHQLVALERLGFGTGWLRTVCHDNGARLLGVRTGGPSAGTPGG
jgi:uncharacterized protein